MAEDIRRIDDVENKKGRKYDATHLDVELSFEGHTTLLDLNDANYSTLRDTLAPYTEAGRRAPASTSRASTGGGSGRRATTRRSSSKPKSKEEEQKAAFNEAVRGWVASERPDLKVADKGRISNEVLAEYKAEHPNWERDFFLDSADDSAPAAPAPTSPSVPEQSTGGAHRVEAEGSVDEHGWSTEPPQQYTGVAPVGSYS